MSIKPLYFNVLLTALFLIAPLYFQPNLGGRGLELTYNIPVWAIASFLIGAGLFLIARKQRFVRPVNSWALLTFPVVMILSGVLAGSSQPIPWLFRQLYVIGGLLFLFSLFQFNVKQRQIEQVLYIIAASALLNALIALTQILSPDLLQGLLPVRGHTPIGIFQQVNVLASFLSTGLIIALYLITRPSIRSVPSIFKVLLIANLGISSFIIVYTGSRIGLLTAVCSILIIAFSRRRQFQQQIALTLMAMVVIIGGSIQGGKGFERVVNKTHEVTQGAAGSQRINMYTIALELVAKEPIHGHGIGNFLRVWGMQSGDYYQRNPDAALHPYVTHPHNELVYWLIEGGIISFAGIIAALGAILLALYRCGVQRGGAYTALLLPISLHTLVELPFYISAVHWFLWLFLLFLVLRHRTIGNSIPLSLSAMRLMKTTAILLCVGISYFMIHSARAQADIYSFATAKAGSKGPFLQIALNNLYSKPYAEELAMRSRLYAGIQAKDPDEVRRFTLWAESHIAVTPQLKMFEDLLNAHTFLQQVEAKCAVASTGAKMYPMNQVLQVLAKSCE